MSSYVYMKILESRPQRYDRTIALLSLGQSDRIKRRLVDERVQSGFKVLEIGVGTGNAAILAARHGAKVIGFDVSPGMLRVARKKIEAEALGDQIELREMGVSGMDRFPDGTFDLVMSTLVFSELSMDEQRYALRHAYRTLKPGGRVAIADEARPRGTGMRLVHSLVRVPLLVLTFAITQTATRPVENLEELVQQAGFKVESTERSQLGSFIYLVAVRDGKE